MSAYLIEALNDKGERVDIELAERGCEYFCPDCEKPVFPKNREPRKIAKYFAHKKGYICESSEETQLHLLAKEVLSETKALMLPPSENGNKPSGFVRFVSLDIEKWDDEYKFRPDAEGITENGERILIEFYVSHMIPNKKRRIILDNHLNCIEIDLNYVDIDEDEIRDLLLNGVDNKEWVVPAIKKEISSDNFSAPYSRSSWQTKAIELIKKRFDDGELFISNGFDDFDLKNKYGYDVCSPTKYYRKFRTDLILYRTKKSPERIAISIRGRRRNETHTPPNLLRVIDIVIKRKEDYERLLETKYLAEIDGFIYFEGFKFRR